MGTSLVELIVPSVAIASLVGGRKPWVVWDRLYLHIQTGSLHLRNASLGEFMRNVP